MVLSCSIILLTIIPFLGSSYLQYVFGDDKSVTSDSKFCNKMTIEELITSGDYFLIDNRGQPAKTIDGTPLADLILAGDKGDEIFGHKGDDCIIGGSGDDYVKGQQGNDMIFGGSGNDILKGGSGDDFVKGQRGNDRIFGGSGDDMLRGNSNQDLIVGNQGADILDGGKRADKCIFDAEDKRVMNCETEINEELPTEPPTKPPTEITWLTCCYTFNDEETSPDGLWYNRYNGYGLSGVKKDTDGSDIFFEYPKTVTKKSKTQANLVITTTEYEDFTMSVDVRTNEQLRENSTPNPWEVAWIFFRYTDPNHFFYFYTGIEGDELGKEDNDLPFPEEDQIFFVTDPKPKTKIGVWATWEITVIDNHIVIFVDGKKVIDYTDDTMSERLASGAIGLYNEDSDVSFRNITINPIT